jgi:hypothetical protein
MSDNGRLKVARLKVNSVESAEILNSDIPQPVRAMKRGKGRSRVTNGSKLLPLSDGRSATARRFRDLYEDITADLGGVAMLSEGQRQLIRRAAMLSAESERMEALAARGEAEFDIDLYGMICDRLGRLFGRLGLERVARPVNDGSQALAEYFSRPPPKEVAAP